MSPSALRSPYHCSPRSEKMMRAVDELITLMTKVCRPVSRRLSVIERGDPLWNSLTHKFQTSEKIRATAQKMSKSGFFVDQDTILELIGKIQELQNENKLYEWVERFSRWTFPRYQSTCVFPTSSSCWWNAEPFYRNAEPHQWAAKFLGHAWYIGKRFCKSNGVFFSTLSARVKSMGL